MVAKKVSGKKVAKKASGKKSTPKVAPPVVETPQTDVATIVAEDTTGYSDEFSHLVTQLRSVQSVLKELTMHAMKLEKKITRDQKVLVKKAKGKVRRNTSGNKAPSGFSKPGEISDELRSFLKLGKGELIARTEVTKRINAYCKENGLQDQADKRKLLPDTTLRKLLRVGKNDELTFFNLQKYMKVHFPNKEGVYPSA